MATFDLAFCVTAASLLCCCASLLVAIVNKRHYLPSLNGLHVAITGGSKGIGFSLAQQCLLEGAYVSLMARTETSLMNAREALIEHVGCPSNRIFVEAVDVSDASAITAAIVKSFEWKPIDILVCNAAIAKCGLFDEMAAQDLDAQYRINFLGSVYPIHAALPLMKRRSHNHPTSIVFMNSLCSMFVACGASTYMCSKSAQKGLAELLKLQLKPHNINVQIVFPGFTETEMLDEVDKFLASSPVWTKFLEFKRENALTADEVARITIAALKRGNFLTTTESLGLHLRVLGRGLLPEDTIFEGMLELAMLLPMRMASHLLLMPKISNLVKSCKSAMPYSSEAVHVKNGT